MPSIKKLAKSWIDYARLPAAAKTAFKQDRQGMPPKDPGAASVVAAGVEWLGRAQECSATKDGGVARHYSVIDGWSPSYPETTGYIVPTLLKHARLTEDSSASARAFRMLDWLVSIQYADGAFQGGMVNQTPRVPVAFNTGQILIGLAAGALADSRYLAPMRKAADWLTAAQDKEGSWSKHSSPFAKSGAKTYDTHIAIGLFRAARADSSRGYREAAMKHTDWAIGNQAKNGWLDACCLDHFSRPLTHTLGYALRGIVEAYLATREERYLAAARLTADGLMGALAPDGRLPGRLDASWRAAGDFVCLTGASQIAESWLLLHRETGVEAYLKAGLLTNRYVRRTVSLEGPPDIRGGVKGSFPIDGEYGRWQYLNWACKFTIDANRLELELTPR